MARRREHRARPVADQPRPQREEEPPEEQGEPIAAERRRAQLILILIGVLAAGYFVQVFTPLRLTGDVVKYLALARDAADGTGFRARLERLNSPPGYPVMLAALDRAGLGTNRAFMTLNYLLLAAAIAAAYFVAGRSFGLKPWQRLLVCCLTLLSVVCMTHAGTPLSEISFLCVSMLSLAAMAAAERLAGARRWAAVAAAAALALAATSIRTVGIALLPAVLWGCVMHGRDLSALLGRLRGRKRLNAALIALVVVAVVGGALLASRTQYCREMAEKYRKLGGAWVGAGKVIDFRLAEFGDLITNTWHVRAPVHISVIGAVTIAAIVFGLWRRRRTPGATDVYLACYLLIMAAWPYPDFRFWLPVLPLLLSLVTAMIARLTPQPIPKPAIIAYLLIFAFLGGQRLHYLGRLSLSGRQFSERYYVAEFQTTYREAFGTREELELRDEQARRDGWPVPAPPPVNAAALRLLRRYEPLARPPGGR